MEVVRAHLVALNERDLDGYLDTCTDDVELWSLLSAVEGPYVGPDGIRRLFHDIGDAAPDSANDVVRLEAVGADRVLSVERWRASGRSSGVGTDQEFTIGTVYEFANDKIKRIHVFGDLNEALEAVGLSE